MRRFEGTGALVTGGASGIGLATAHRFASEGAEVVLLDIDPDAAERAAAEIVKDGGKAMAVGGDVTDAEDIGRTCVEIFARVAGMRVLVNCAGILVPEMFLEAKAETIRRVLDVNVTGTALMGQAFARALIDAGTARGRIINIASIAGLQGIASRTAYGSSKAAVINLTKVMATELASHGITVNAVAPGPIETPMVLAGHTEQTRAEFNKSVPMARYGRPEEVAGTIAFLASDDASYVAGHVLVVDGGWNAAGIIKTL
ncbi:MAG: SDR family NAD(P)-dependent oxidoreductase [Methyloligellaceae bacterium]